MSRPPSTHHRYDVVVQIGHFQPWLVAHQQALAHALELAPRVALILAGDHLPASARHPFPTADRLAQLRLALPESWRETVQLAALGESYQPDDTRAECQALVQRLSRREVPRIGVMVAPDFHHFQPPTSWQIIPYPSDSDPGVSWRQAALGNQDPEHVLRDHHHELVPATRPWFESWVRSGIRETLHQEWRLLQSERAAWAAAPYPPTLVTVDAVVECAGHVLLIRRGRHPGQGLWALPGGFIDIHESLLTSCYRELHEETGLDLRAAGAAPLANAVFDAPYRSQRGRVITHAYHFYLPGELPKVLADDDAALAIWLAKSGLADCYHQLHDDHALILEHFLAWRGDRPLLRRLSH